MFPSRVIKAIDVFEEGDLDVAPVTPPNQFCLQGLEEALGGRVVIAIAPAAYRYAERMPAKDFLIFMGTVQGGFNRLSQRPSSGGVDSDRTATIREVHA